MQVAVFSTQAFERPYLQTAAQGSDIHWRWLNERLTPQTAPLAAGCQAVAAFVLDDLGEPSLSALQAQGVKLVCLRAAGFNNLNVSAGHQLGMAMARAAAYSPSAVAEHAVTLLLTLVRKPCLAQARLPGGDGRLDGLLGFDLNGKTVGVIGTGRIGSRFARILHAFGAQVVAHDLVSNPELVALGIRYTSLEALLADSDVVSLHCPLCDDTQRLLNRTQLQRMKPGALLINTARGGLVDTAALIDLLRSGHLGGAGLDVVEGEQSLFFADHRDQGVTDAQIAQLLALPNVIMTPHQAFFTHEAITNIAQATVANLTGWQQGDIPLPNRL